MNRLLQWIEYKKYVFSEDKAPQPLMPADPVKADYYRLGIGSGDRRREFMEHYKGKVRKFSDETMMLLLSQPIITSGGHTSEYSVREAVDFAWRNFGTQSILRTLTTEWDWVEEMYYGFLTQAGPIYFFDFFGPVYERESAVRRVMLRRAAIITPYMATYSLWCNMMADTSWDGKTGIEEE